MRAGVMFITKSNFRTRVTACRRRTGIPDEGIGSFLPPDAELSFVEAATRALKAVFDA
jgi:hypothetical protein